MLLDHLMDKNGNQRCQQLKEMIQCGEDWCHWCTILHLPKGRAPEEGQYTAKHCIKQHQIPPKNLSTVVAAFLHGKRSLHPNTNQLLLKLLRPNAIHDFGGLVRMVNLPSTTW